ncbi:Uncharacterised protein g10598 [Pycnogonum litorale]
MKLMDHISFTVLLLITLICLENSQAVKEVKYKQQWNVITDKTNDAKGKVEALAKRLGLVMIDQMNESASYVYVLEYQGANGTSTNENRYVTKLLQEDPIVRIAVQVKILKRTPRLQHRRQNSEKDGMYYAQVKS